MDNFIIKQINCDSPNLKENIDLCNILKVAAVPFSRGLPIDEFVNVEVNYALKNKWVWQHIYLVNQENNVIASLGTVMRKSVTPDLWNLCITMVNTDENYRGRGIMSKLIEWTIAFYEGYGKEIDLGPWKVDAIKEFESFIDKYIVDKKMYWNLYSGVGKYYEKFGFKEFRNLNWLKSEPVKEIIEDFNVDEFDLKKGSEEFVTWNNVHELYLSDEWLPNHKKFESIGKSVRCVSFKEPIYFRFLERGKKYSELHGIKHGKFGFVIEEPNGERSMIFVAEYFTMYQLVIHRIFSNVSDTKVLEKHLCRLYEFLQYYLKEYYSKLPVVVNSSEGAQRVLLTEGDIISTKLESRIIKLWFQNKLKWKYDGSNKTLLPMLKEFGRDAVTGQDLVWPYNGFWCFD